MTKSLLNEDPKDCSKVGLNPFCKLNLPPEATLVNSFLTPLPFPLFRMTEKENKFAQPDEDTPFGRHLKEVTRYLNIGIPSFTGTYNATLPEEEQWMI